MYKKGWNHRQSHADRPSTVEIGDKRGLIIGSPRSTREKWNNEQRDIDKLEEFQRNVDVLRITYKGYIEERNLKDIAPGKGIVSMNVRSLEKNHDSRQLSKNSQPNNSLHTRGMAT